MAQPVKTSLNADSILALLGWGKADVANLAAINVTFKLTLSGIQVQVGGLAFENVPVSVAFLLGLSKGAGFSLSEYQEVKAALFKAVKNAKKVAVGADTEKAVKPPKPKKHLMMNPTMILGPDIIQEIPEPDASPWAATFIAKTLKEMVQEAKAKVKNLEPTITVVTKKTGALDKLPNLLNTDFAELEKKAVSTKETPKPLPQPVINFGTQHMTSAFPAWTEFDLGQMKYATRVQLKDAVSMYQPVKGSSAESRYYVVGGNDDLKVAARYSGSKLSIRIEGENWKKYQKQVVETGFSVNSDYASVHLNVGADKKLASKTLGAVILGLGVPFTSPLPEFEKLAKG